MWLMVCGSCFVWVVFVGAGLRGGLVDGLVYLV